MSGRHAPSADELTSAIAAVMGSVLPEAPTPPTARQVREKLLKDHPTWTIPERRVQKFIKKQNSSNKNGGDEVSLLSMGSAGNRKGFLGLIIGSRQPKENPAAPESCPEHSESNTSVNSANRLGAKMKKAVQALSPRKKAKARVPPGGIDVISEQPFPTLDTDNTEEASNKQTVDTNVEDGEHDKNDVAEKVEAAAVEETNVAVDVVAEPKAEDESRDLAYADDNDGKKGGALCEGCATCVIL